jgi:hypothetical protein
MVKEMNCSYSGVVEDAETHRPVLHRVMAWRTNGTERVGDFTAHHRIDGPFHFDRHGWIT